MSVRLAHTAQQQMFCYQCEQTRGGVGCSTKGICGKTSVTSNLQDLLVYATAGIAQLANSCVKKDIKISPEVNNFILTSIFSTITNVNFDEKRIHKYLQDAASHQKLLRDIYISAVGSLDDIKDGPAKLEIPKEMKELESLGRKYGVVGRKNQLGDEDRHSLQELCLYGVKGAIAYLDHAERIRALHPEAYSQGQSDALFVSLYSILDRIFDPSDALGELVGLAMEVGAFNGQVMATLDGAHAVTFGISVPTTVSTIPKEGPAIVVSGHDMVDLLHVLEQTEGTGVNVYTHGEMLPAHGYPRLAAFPHLVGHFGQAWMKQRKDFVNFPGAIVMTSNCILEPDSSYASRIFTTNATGVHNVKHIEDYDFSAVVEVAKSCPGFTGGGAILKSSSAASSFQTGYSQSFADTDAATSELAQAVLQGKLTNVFVVGGCDGTEGQRNYFTHFGEELPDQAVILTLGCGKFRLNHLPIAQQTLEGTNVPRVIDVGQCNDAYGAVRMAASLATALGTTIDKLPLHFALSWFEQKVFEM